MLRAAVSVALLGGFYLYALVIVAAVAAGTVYTVSRFGSSRASVEVIGIGLGITVAVLVALWRALRHKASPPQGVRLSRNDAPGLWALAEASAEAAGTRGPDEILVDAEFNAAVSEESKALGLVGGRRYLIVGLPLLASFDTGRFRAVIGHEFGHYSQSHTRLGAVAYRGHVAVRLMLDAFAGRRFNPVTWLFKAYAALFFTVQAGVSRAQEFEADQVAARLTGGENTRAAFRELPVMAAAWSRFQQQYMLLGASEKLVPDDLFGGFASFREGRAGEIAELREQPLPSETQRLDTHPSIASRVAALEGAPGEPQPGDEAPAAGLLADFDAVAKRVDAEWISPGVERVPWSELCQRTVGSAQRKRADAAFRAVERVLGPGKASLDALIAEVKDGRGEVLWQELEAANFPRDGVQAIVATAAIDSGALRFELSWDGPMRQVGKDGEPVALDELTAPLFDADADGEAARGVLAARGIDLALAVSSGRTTAASHAAAQAKIIAASDVVELNGEKRHLFVATTGFAFLPIDPRAKEGEQRLKQVMQECGSVEGLVRAAALWLPTEEVRHMEQLKGMSYKARIVTQDGTEHVLVQKLMSDDIGKPFDLIAEYAAGRASRE
ncbi:hypothetical protein GCM10009830_07220 [Glycomyces endophyticus]|uniref:Peptidase M48 domain-containing protein n=1 Tax=Glycomyces endophyticus TaxID=480996 RepID=A0ABN2G3A2_9ACTN